MADSDVPIDSPEAPRIFRRLADLIHLRLRASIALTLGEGLRFDGLRMRIFCPWCGVRVSLLVPTNDWLLCLGCVPVSYPRPATERR